MGKSSFEKITDALYETGEFKSLMIEIKERIQSTKITHYAGACNSYDPKATLMVHMETEYCGKKNEAASNVGNMKTNPFWTISRDLYLPDSFKAIFNANFGVLKPNSTKKYRVPTYNVKRDKAYEHFASNARGKIAVEFDTMIKDKSSQIRNQALEFDTTPMADQIKQDTRDRFTIDSIKETLLRFKDARPEILKAAMDEFVCHAIMEN
jgi:hypothetical protein